MKTIVLVCCLAAPPVALMVLLMMYVDGRVGPAALLLALFAIFAVAATAIVFHGLDFSEADSTPEDSR